MPTYVSRQELYPQLTGPGIPQILSALEQGGGKSALSCYGPSTCVVEGDRFLVCADFISGLAAVVPSILWGYSLNDECALGVHMDSRVTPEKHVTYGGPIVIINNKSVSLANEIQTLAGFSGAGRLRNLSF